MKSLLPILLACASVALAGVPAQAQQPGTRPAGRFVLAIQGGAAGLVREVSGGNLRAEVAELRSGPSPYAQKMVSGVEYDPLEMKVDFEAPRSLFDWIHTSLQGGNETKTAALHWVDPSGVVRTTRVFESALLDSVTFPALDASSAEPARFGISLRPEAVRHEQPANAGVAPSPVHRGRWLRSRFRLELGDLPCQHVAKIDAFTWKLRLARQSGGPRRVYGDQPAGVELSNIGLRVSNADLAPWTQWFESAVIQGNAAQEVSGALTFLAADGSTLGRLALSNVGIFELGLPGAEGTPEAGTFGVKLYVESVGFTLPDASTGP